MEWMMAWADLSQSHVPLEALGESRFVENQIAFPRLQRREDER
jgi:hypothetical protein